MKGLFVVLFHLLHPSVCPFVLALFQRPFESKRITALNNPGSRHQYGFYLVKLTPPKHKLPSSPPLAVYRAHPPLQQAPCSPPAPLSLVCSGRCLATRRDTPEVSNRLP